MEHTIDTNTNEVLINDSMVIDFDTFDFNAIEDDNKGLNDYKDEMGDYEDGNITGSVWDLDTDDIKIEDQEQPDDEDASELFDEDEVEAARYEQEQTNFDEFADDATFTLDGSEITAGEIRQLKREQEAHKVRQTESAQLHNQLTAQTAQMRNQLVGLTLETDAMLQAEYRALQSAQDYATKGQINENIAMLNQRKQVINQRVQALEAHTKSILNQRQGAFIQELKNTYPTDFQNRAKNVSSYLQTQGIDVNFLLNNPDIKLFKALEKAMMADSVVKAKEPKLKTRSANSTYRKEVMQGKPKVDITDTDNAFNFLED